MGKISTERLAKILGRLVAVILAANLICLLLVPGIVAYVADGGPSMLVKALRAEAELWLGRGEETHFPMALVFLTAWKAVWTRLDTALLTLFYWMCGVCTALILRQAGKILDTILKGEPFQRANARALKRAAMCCWVISGGALVRLLLWLWAEGGVAPIFTYNTLFIPGFFMAGLLFLVMSALFRQAAELKEEQDLTI